MAKNLITGGFTGRLGNQMFQIAAVIALAKKHGVDYTFQKPRPETDPNPIYFDHFPDIGITIEERTYHNENPTEYQEIPYTGGVLCLCGYYQSYKYFEQYKDDIISAFGIPHSHINNTVSIHVRRNDYKVGTPFEPVDMNYISKAVEIMSSKGYNNFVVFSDDMDWCKQNINDTVFQYKTFEYSEGRSPIRDLEYMSCCMHNIIANSTFSWWGAYLNRYKDKVVIAPTKWFNGVNRDLLPESWIKL